jgi:hypothetical protein
MRVTVRLTPEELALVVEGLTCLAGEAANMVVTCPDPEAYADAVRMYRRKEAQCQELAARILGTKEDKTT